MNGLWRCALVALILTAGTQPAFAQRWACDTIQPGETAASLALRIAGSADQRHQGWFQIFDPAASRFVVKARYDHIRPGWLACVSNADSGAPPVIVRTVPAEHTPSAWAAIDRTLGGIQPDAGWYLVLLLLMTPFAWRIADRHWTQHQALVVEMTQFGGKFIREFERPLIQPRASEPAVRSRMRFKPHRGRLEVLLAPGTGRSYPNLSDHRKNVEYDVERVLKALRNEPFVNDSPHQQGQWVVVPFRVNTREKMEGTA